MVKREREKNTLEDFKQVFRVFDKVRTDIKTKQDKSSGIARYWISPAWQDGNGYVSTSELKFVMTRLKVNSNL